MDVQAEAILHLNCFQDENKAREIVKSSGLTLSELGDGRVQVWGQYSRLKAASFRLKELLEAPTKPTQHFSWSGEKAPSGPDSRRPGRSTLNRTKSLPKSKSPHSLLSPTLFSRSRDRQNSMRMQNSFRSESFYIEADVFKYGQWMKSEEIQHILHKYSVQLHPEENCDSVTLTVKGSDPNKAAFDLQCLFSDLSKSLRTQDVPKKEMGRDGDALWKKIKKSRNPYKSVLVCEKEDLLHLIGPSEESYMLKQKLLEGPLTKRGSFRLKKFTLHPKSPKISVKEGMVNGDDPPVGGAVGGVPGRVHDLSEPRGPTGFWRLGSKRKKEKPDRTHRQQEETETPSKSSIANFFSRMFPKSKKPKNKKHEK